MDTVGAAIEAPENTLPSFKIAKKLGVYGVEMDLHTSNKGNGAKKFPYDQWTHKKASYKCKYEPY